MVSEGIKPSIIVTRWLSHILIKSQEQITKEYYKDYLAITEPMFIKPREAKIYKAVPGLSTNKPIA